MRKFRRWLKDPRFEPVQGLSRLVGRWFSDHFTANQMTLLGLILCAPLFVAFADDNYLLGSVLLTVSLITDFIDGALGRYQQSDRPVMTLGEELKLTRLERINYRGVTHFGREFDPLVDKIRFLCVFLPLGIGYVSLWLVIAIVIVAILLTVMRPIKQRLKLDAVSSNRFGKFKIWAEIVGMALLVFLPLDAEAYWQIITDIVFSIALLLGLASLGGHIYTGWISYRKRSRRVIRLVATSRRPSAP